MKIGRRSGGTEGATPRQERGTNDRQPPASDGACVEDVAPQTSLPEPAPTLVVGTVAPRRRDPLTKDILFELYQDILRDIQAWEARHGYTAVPPLEILRQVTQLAETITKSTQRF